MGQDFAREDPGPVPGTTDPSIEPSFVLFEQHRAGETGARVAPAASTKALLGLLRAERHAVLDRPDRNISTPKEATSLITVHELTDVLERSFDWVAGNMSAEEIREEASNYVTPAYALRCLVVNQQNFKEAARLVKLCRELGAPLGHAPLIGRLGPYPASLPLLFC